VLLLDRREGSAEEVEREVHSRWGA
jgi:hypothetical protein